MSLTDNEDSTRMGMVAIDFTLIRTRSHILRMNNIQADNYKNSLYPGLTTQGTANDVAFLTNSIANNYSTKLAFYSFRFLSKLLSLLFLLFRFSIIHQYKCSVLNLKKFQD